MSHDILETLALLGCVVIAGTSVLVFWFAIAWPRSLRREVVPKSRNRASPSAAMEHKP